MILIGWMVYALAVSLLLAAAAACLDHGLSRARLPSRGVWGAALVLSVAIPAVELVSTRSTTRPSAPVVQGTLPVVGHWAGAPTASVQATATSRPWSAPSTPAGAWLSRTLERGVSLLPAGPAAARWAGTLWGAMSLGLLLVLVVVCALLSRRRRDWARVELRGRRVRVARRVGPAVVGILRPEIVLPAWAMHLDDEELELVLTHEEEHVRARDPLLLAGGLLGVLLAPWNPVFWWQLRRLREAVEVDCDRRVLLRGAPAHRYGSLLVRLGSRAWTGPVASPALLSRHPSSLLLRRLNAMKKARGRGGVPALFAATIASALLVLAFEADTPPPSSGTDRPVVQRRAAPVEGAERAGARPPASRPSEFIRLVELREAGPEEAPGGVAVGRAAPGDEGAAPARPAAGEAARGEAAPEARERPVDPQRESADDAGRVEPEPRPREAVPVQAARVGATAPQTSPAAPAPAAGLDDADEANPADRPAEPDRQPTFTPFEVAPDVRNRPQIQQALQREYPALLRDAGIGGTTVLWFFINGQGTVESYQVAQSSGHAQLDAAALRVADVFEFTPALNRDQRVPVWVQIPITFQTSGGGAPRS